MLPPAPAISPVTIPAPLIVDTAVALEADFVARFPAGFTFPLYWITKMIGHSYLDIKQI